MNYKTFATNSENYACDKIFLCCDSNFQKLIRDR
jgi:hypothetical protein